MYTFLLPWFFAVNEAYLRAQPVEVQYKQASSTEPQSSAEQTVELDALLIGSTEKFAFFYDDTADEALVIPHTQIIYIRIPVTE